MSHHNPALPLFFDDQPHLARPWGQGAAQWRRVARALVGTALFAALWLAAAPALAQAVYTCRDETGNTYTLSRPCPKGMKTTSVSAGPVASEQRSTPRYEESYNRPQPVSPGPEYQRYMSARCRTLSDTARSGYSRGIKADVLSGMQREYERDCREEERDASSRYHQEQRDARLQRREEERQVKLAVEASQEEENRRVVQCKESRRILGIKRARTDLTEGERRDLNRFEEAVEQRCMR